MIVPLDLPRPTRLDQLPGDGAQQRVRDGRRADRPQAADPPHRFAEQRVAGEAAEELRVVVVEAEHEAHVLDTGLAVGGDHDRAVGALRRLHLLEPAVDRDRRAEDALGTSTRVASAAASASERRRRVRALRAELRRGPSTERE